MPRKAFNINSKFSLKFLLPIISKSKVWIKSQIFFGMKQDLKKLHCEGFLFPTTTTQNHAS